MRVIRGAWSDEIAHARGKQSGRSLVEAKADCVTERVNAVWNVSDYIGLSTSPHAQPPKSERSSIFIATFNFIVNSINVMPFNINLPCATVSIKYTMFKALYIQ